MKQLVSIFTRRMGRAVFAAGALAAVVAADPAVSADELFVPSVCESCHPGMPNYQCGVLVLNAISGCCGMGNGNAECLGTVFLVDCESGGHCHCDKWGDNCEQREDQ